MCSTFRNVEKGIKSQHDAQISFDQTLVTMIRMGICKRQLIQYMLNELLDSVRSTAPYSIRRVPLLEKGAA